MHLHTLPLFIEYVTLLSAPGCYIRLTLENSSTVKTDLTYYSGVIQVLLVFLKLGCCLLRILGQDLLFLLCLPLLHQSTINHSLQDHRCSVKIISSTFPGSLTHPYQTARLHCTFPLVFWTASVKSVLPLKWNEAKCSLLKCQLLFCSSLVYF